MKSGENTRLANNVAWQAPEPSGIAAGLIGDRGTYRHRNTIIRRPVKAIHKFPYRCRITGARVCLWSCLRALSPDRGAPWSHTWIVMISPTWVELGHAFC